MKSILFSKNINISLYSEEFQAMSLLSIEILGTDSISLNAIIFNSILWVLFFVLTTLSV